MSVLHALGDGGKIMSMWLELKLRNPGKARQLVLFGAALFAVLFLILGIMAILQDRDFRQRAIASSATVISHVRDPSPSTRCALCLLDPRMVPKIGYPDASGVEREAVLSSRSAGDFPLGMTFAILHDPSSPGRVRLPGDSGASIGWTFVAAAVSLAAALAWRSLRRRRH